MTRAAFRSGRSIVERPQNVEAALWRKFRFEDDRACRLKLFNHYRDMARRIAAKQLYRRPTYGLELADLEQLAYSGLLEAIDRFDPLKGAPFPAYAKHRIKGSISDGIMQSTERSAQYAHARRIEIERLKSLGLDSPAGRQDPLNHVADLAVSLAIGFLLEQAGLAQNAATADPHPGAYESLAWRETQLTLVEEISKLPPPQPDIIQQHYLGGVQFAQIAKLMNLSKGRVSQLHRAALDRLRKRLKSIR